MRDYSIQWGRYFALGFITAFTLFVASSGVASESGLNATTVAVVEPRVEVPGLGYSVSINGRKFESTKAVLDALGETAGSRLMLLVRADIQIGRIKEIAAMASKAGYGRDSVHLFIFDEKRGEIVAIPGFRYGDYSEDPEVLSQLLRTSENQD